MKKVNSARADVPALNPGLIVYKIEDLGGADANVRFKNLSGRPVSFVFGIGKQQIEHRVKLPVGEEVEFTLHIPGDAMLRALARVRVTDLVFCK